MGCYAAIIVANGKTIKNDDEEETELSASYNTHTHVCRTYVRFVANSRHSAYFKRKYGEEKLMTQKGMKRRKRKTEKQRTICAPFSLFSFFLSHLLLHLALSPMTCLCRVQGTAIASVSLTSNRTLCDYIYVRFVRRTYMRMSKKILQNLVKRVK